LTAIAAARVSEVKRGLQVIGAIMAEA